jgi:hypothetical protein
MRHRRLERVEDERRIAGRRARAALLAARPLSTTTRREILSGKFAANEMARRPQAECPATMSPVLASIE